MITLNLFELVIIAFLYANQIIGMIAPVVGFMLSLGLLFFVFDFFSRQMAGVFGKNIRNGSAKSSPRGSRGADGGKKKEVSYAKRTTTLRADATFYANRFNRTASMRDYQIYKKFYRRYRKSGGKEYISVYDDLQNI